MAKLKEFDPVEAFRLIVRMRAVDEALADAWADGLVPGEYHAGIGEEAIVAGVTMHLDGNDAMALDHRSTAAFIARGADPRLLMLEVMGSEKGMNGGRAGHMHLMDPALRAAADGIVGASGPLAIGHAVALTRLDPGRVAIAFHGEGAMNQGMLMESYNLAVVWRLPVVFVCKDNRWSITTHAPDVTGGSIGDRAKSFGLALEKVRGDNPREVYEAAGRLIARARRGKGPGFLHATCHRPRGHLEGDPMVRLHEHPVKQGSEFSAAVRSGIQGYSPGGRGDKARGVGAIAARGLRFAKDRSLKARRDPLERARSNMDEDAARAIEDRERSEILAALAAARDEVGTRTTFGIHTKDTG